MSDEQEGKIEETFIDRLGAKYPMAKIKKGDTQAYGIKFYPSVYCLAPDGTVSLTAGTNAFATVTADLADATFGIVPSGRTISITSRSCTSL